MENSIGAVRTTSGTTTSTMRNASAIASPTSARTSQVERSRRHSSASARSTISDITTENSDCNAGESAFIQATLSVSRGRAAPTCCSIARVMKRAVIGVPS